QGDGGLSSYAMSVDQAPIGTFYSDGRGVVCIDVAASLADGLHVLSGTELAPHAGTVVGTLAFSVDTVAPTPPTQPALSSWSDSGAQGDGITRFRTITLTGTADPADAVQLYSAGVTGIGGAKTDVTGHWSATTVSLSDGTYTIAAITVDSAGN